MPQSTLPTALFASLLFCACGSTGGTTSSQAPVQPMDDPSVEMNGGGVKDPSLAVKPWAPAPWTGGFTGTAVMLADAVRIEGPTGLLEHVVASSDDAFYERSLETTPRGLRQVIRRTSPDVPEIRVQLDAWTIAAFDRVVILERIDDSPVRVIASGDALWRDSDGRIASADRIECRGEIGDETLSIPDGAVEAPAADSSDGQAAATTDAPGEAGDAGQDSVEDSVEDSGENSDENVTNVNESGGDAAMAAPETATGPMDPNQ